MPSKIKATDLIKLARQAHADGYRCFLDGDGNNASFYSGQLSAYMTVLTEYFDKSEGNILAMIKKANQKTSYNNL